MSTIRNSFRRDYIILIRVETLTMTIKTLSNVTMKKKNITRADDTRINKKN